MSSLSSSSLSSSEDGSAIAFFFLGFLLGGDFFDFCVFLERLISLTSVERLWSRVWSLSLNICSTDLVEVFKDARELLLPLTNSFCVSDPEFDCCDLKSLTCFARTVQIEVKVLC